MLFLGSLEAAWWVRHGASDCSTIVETLYNHLFILLIVCASCAQPVSLLHMLHDEGVTLVYGRFVAKGDVSGCVG